MPLLRGGRFVPDGWRELADGEAVPDGGAVVVPLARLLADAAAIAGFRGALGVRLEPDQRVEQVEPWLPRLSLVVLTFPVFSDGRAFSMARILRERYGFRGEVRAVGDVQIDRYQFMRQCGFDAFEIAPERASACWARAEIEMGLIYQPDYAEPHGAEAVWRVRQAARQALAAE
jgi:uncharacterized protein (DUF934 family)